jgi:hypothetical protein
MDIEDIRKIANTDEFFIMSMIAFAWWLITFPFELYRKIKIMIQVLSQNIIKSILFTLIIIVILFMAPIIWLIKSFEYSGWIFVTSQILCWFFIFCFLVFIRISIPMFRIINKMKLPDP